MTGWLNRCDCPGACDCADTRDQHALRGWADIDEATTPLHKRAHGQGTSRPHPLTGPADGQHTAAAQPRESTDTPGLRTVAADERATRARLYPVGTVIAMPARPPLNSDGPGMPPEAA